MNGKIDVTKRPAKITAITFLTRKKNCWLKNLNLVSLNK